MLDWHGTALLHLTIAKADVTGFEADVRRWVDQVSGQEPGTLLYGFYRSHEPQAAESELASYLHTMAYRDAASQQVHWDYEADWWWDTFSGYLKGPIRSERFAAPDLIASWASPDSVDDDLVVARLDSGASDAASRKSDGFGWIGRPVVSDDSFWSSPDPNVLTVVSSVRNGTAPVDGEVFGGSSHPPVAVVIR